MSEEKFFHVGERSEDAIAPTQFEVGPMASAI